MVGGCSYPRDLLGSAPINQGIARKGKLVKFRTDRRCLSKLPNLGDSTTMVPAVRVVDWFHATLAVELWDNATSVPVVRWNCCVECFQAALVVRLDGHSLAEPKSKCRNSQETSEPVVSPPVTKEKAPYKKMRTTAIENEHQTERTPYEKETNEKKNGKRYSLRGL